jgi:hypothetical protein
MIELNASSTLLQPKFRVLFIRGNQVVSADAFSRFGTFTILTNFMEDATAHEGDVIRLMDEPGSSKSKPIETYWFYYGKWNGEPKLKPKFSADKIAAFMKDYFTKKDYTQRLGQQFVNKFNIRTDNPKDTQELFNAENNRSQEIIWSNYVEGS